jgi:hypothetical protein
MKLYHGTNLVVDRPRIVNRFKTLDFGEGFYTTENEEQAREFAVKVSARREPSLSPVVNCYEFSVDDAALSVLRFDAPDEKWLDFVVANRRGEGPTDKYDVVTGPVANDDVFGTIVLYEAGQLDKESAILRFRVKKLFNQVVFCSEAALERLKFIESYEVEGAI